jgi:hypothetical protein
VTVSDWTWVVPQPLLALRRYRLAPQFALLGQFLPERLDGFTVEHQQAQQIARPTPKLSRRVSSGSIAGLTSASVDAR